MPAPEFFAELIDTLYALTGVMEEESEALALSGARGHIAELVQAKLRLAARMERLSVQLARKNPLWMEALESEERALFAEANDELHKAATVNSAILERQIDLSTEMVQVVGLEMERLAGRRGATCSHLSDIRRAQAVLPLSVNQR